MGALLNTQILPLTKVADANEGGQAVVDLLNYSNNCHFILNAKSDAGTNPTCDVKLQESDLAVGASYLTEGAVDTKLRSGASTNVKLAAAFTQSGNASVGAVYLRIKTNGAVAAGNLTLTIEADSTGDPSGTPLSTATVSTTAVSSTYTWVKFEFAKPLDLTNASIYHIVLAGAYSVSNTVNVTWRTKGSLADGGNVSAFDATNWAADSTSSFEFYTDQYVFTDITGLTFTQVAGTTATSETKVKNIDAPKRYMRAHVAIGGTSTPAYYVSVGCFGFSL